MALTSQPDAPDAPLWAIGLLAALVAVGRVLHALNERASHHS